MEPGENPSMDDSNNSPELLSRYDEILNYKFNMEDIKHHNSEDETFNLDDIQTGFVLGGGSRRYLIHETTLGDWKGKTFKEVIENYGIDNLKKLIKEMKGGNYKYIELSCSWYSSDALPSTNDTISILSLDLTELLELKKMIFGEEKTFIDNTKILVSSLLGISK